MSLTGMPARARVEPHQSSRRRREHDRGAAHVLPQELFRGLLLRERRRAERFNEPFVLLLVRAVDRPQTLDSSAWGDVIEALALAAGEGTVLGWYEAGTVLGATVPEVRGWDPRPRVRRQLAGRVGPETAARFSIRSRLYDPHAGQFAQDGSPSPVPLESNSEARRTGYDGVKRALDVVGSLILLLLLSPVFVLIAALLKLTCPGPVLFRQTRIGHRGKPFTMLKFRTMRTNVDPGLHHEYVTRFIKSSAQVHAAGRKALFKLTNDPRVTPIGRVLRKSSLDELPQLWNVLQGEMSLVGPRPPLEYEVAQYQPWHRRRVLDAKPGITGLWQVVGRSRTTFDEMVRLDLRYARTRSFWTDLKILFATPKAVISGKGAG